MTKKISLGAGLALAFIFFSSVTRAEWVDDG